MDAQELTNHRGAAKGRIAAKFHELRARGECALIPYIVAGDPDLERTARLVIELEARGADLIELGVPFSDPMADGPANQRASARGLASGATLAAIMAMVEELRKATEIPLILFGYFNPILHYGCERLCADAARVGIDALLVVDLPPEEAEELARPARAAGLDLIYLLAPTTPIERSNRIAHSANGFLYYVSVTGVTGARAQLAADLERNVSELRGVTKLPIGVGFGISTPEQARQVAAFADAVVVGSAISLLIENNVAADGLVSKVGEFAGALKAAMRIARTGAAMERTE
jgi:tryptophan synthase alpha chain